MDSTTVFETSKNKNGVPYLSIKETDNFGEKYYYTERAGRDSIAFVLFSTDKARQEKGKFIGLINEYKPPFGQFKVTAFGGSLDNPDKTIEEMLIQEVREEAGYDITKANIMSLGKAIVSTQMNQVVHLFMVLVNASYYKGTKPHNKCEKQSKIVWMQPEQALLSVECLKAATIVSRSLAISEKMAPSTIIMPEQGLIV